MWMPGSSAAIRLRVHDRGESARLDAILRLTDLAGLARPGDELLAKLAEELAEILAADVVSIYVREHVDGDVLVMRGNVGFAPTAIGNVRLAVGEGITGFVAECLRPVSCAIAEREAIYKHVPGLGEERFPALLALPLLSGGEAVGVLVLQRREARAFAPGEVALAAALTSPVTTAIERIAARARHGSIVPLGGRAVALTGSGLAPGTGLGRALSLPSLGGGPATLPRSPRKPGAIDELFEQVAGELEYALSRLSRCGSGRAQAASGAAAAAAETEPVGGRGDLGGLARPLHARAYALVAMLYDQRVRELAASACSDQGLAAGLRHVVREYARVPYRLAAEDEGAAWLRERAEEIEDLCVLVAAEAQGQHAPSAGTVLITPRLTGCLALAAVARRASAIVVGGPVGPGSLAEALLSAGGVPAVADVAGLFSWVRSDDRLLVDGNIGTVRVNPAAAEEAAWRKRG